MLFPTLEFAVFFLCVYILVWATKSNHIRKTILVGSSYFFYGYWDIRFTLLLFQCSLSNYLIGYLIAKTPLESASKRKALMWLAAIFNLGVLCVFKYYGFFLSSVNDIAMTLGLDREIPIMEILLPVGISFFTFQGISYIVDLYKGRLREASNLMDVMLYVSFFPQLVAGPIVRADEFLPQLTKTPDKNQIPAIFAFTLISIGLIKKVFIAHYLSQELVNPVFEDPLAFSALDTLVGIYGYAVQIYCDFSAYSDMAIGFAALLGYRFQKNFDQPYRSASLQEFWRRWHISLSSWLRDYLYIPLGGNKKGVWKTYRNLFITMFLGGLWHGAAWKFIIWGSMHGCYLAVEKAGRDKFGRFGKDALSRTVSKMITFHFVCFTWIFFAAPSELVAFEYLSSFANINLEPQMINPFTLMLVFIPLACQFLPDNMMERTEKALTSLPVPAQGIVLGSLLILLSAISPPGVSPFIYFQF